MKTIVYFTIFLASSFGFSNHCFKLRNTEKEETICENFETLLGIPKNLSDSIDWRDKNVVTPVKNQGNCGSCWTFSSTGAMEGAYAVYYGKLKSFSEQQLLDCVKKDSGCEGGEMIDAFEYISDNPVCTEEQDPYKAKDEYCITCNSQVKFSGCLIIPKNNQIALKQALVMLGPVSVGIQADQPIFKEYKGGIIRNESCGTNVDHGVLVVGYGEEDGIKYWLVKNSWGENWGENGYVRILREDSTNSVGICGIGTSASIPYI